MYYLFCKNGDGNTLLVGNKRAVLDYYQGEMPFCDVEDGTVKNKTDLARLVRDLGTPVDVRMIKAYVVDFYFGKEILQEAKTAEHQK